jgi:hypothetical protein
VQLIRQVQQRASQPCHSSRRPGENNSALRAQRLQVHIEPVARRLVYGPQGAKDSNAIPTPYPPPVPITSYILPIADPILLNVPIVLDAGPRGAYQVRTIMVPHSYPPPDTWYPTVCVYTTPNLSPPYPPYPVPLHYPLPVTYLQLGTYMVGILGQVLTRDRRCSDEVVGAGVYAYPVSC